MATLRDVEDIVAKLSSDKAKTREEGIKLLHSYLEGGNCKSFCLLLDQHSLKLKLQERPRPGSWPYLLGVLFQCISTEVSLNKKRGPKLIMAKTLKSFIQHAEDVKRSGKTLILLRSMKGFFGHLWDVIRDFPSFQPDYSGILRQLFAVPEYALSMKKKIYTGIVLFYMKKIKASLCNGAPRLLTSKDELFRNAMTLNCLLNCPLGDFPEDLRKDLMQGFIEIFGHLRDEGKVARKLLSSLNLFLLKDGPNIASHAQEIHSAVQDFMLQSWQRTHDSLLKDGLILYARIQLKLRGILANGDAVFDQLLDLVVKELDQTSNASIIIFRHYDCGKDDKLPVGVLSSSIHNLMELAAVVLYERSKNERVSSTPKRIKKDSINSIIMDRLTNAKCAWCHAICVLIHHYSSDLPKSFILDWLHVISTNIYRILEDGVNAHSYDGPLWILRCLDELCLKWQSAIGAEQSDASEICYQAKDAWQLIWNALLHWVPVYIKVNTMLEASFRLLGNMICEPLYSLTPEFWNLRAFTDSPSGATLHFVASYLTSPRCQIIHQRKSMLKGILSNLDLMDQLGGDNQYCLAFTHAIFAVCIGCIPSARCPTCDPNRLQNMHISRNIETFYQVEEQDKVVENELTLLDRSEQYLAASGSKEYKAQDKRRKAGSTGLLPSSFRDSLWQEMEDFLHKKISSTLKENKEISLTSLFSMCTVLSEILFGSIHMNMQRSTVLLSMPMESVLGGLHDTLVHLIDIIEKNVNIFKQGVDYVVGIAFAPFLCIDQSTVSSCMNLMNSSVFCKLRHEKCALKDSFWDTAFSLFEKLLHSLCSYFELGSDILKSNNISHVSLQGCANGLDDEFESTALQDGDGKDRIIDVDLDIEQGLKTSSLGTQRDGNTALPGTKYCSGIPFSPCKWRSNMILILSSFNLLFPDITCDTLLRLLRLEVDHEARIIILAQLCGSSSVRTIHHVSFLGNTMNELMENGQGLESSVYSILCAMDILLEQLACPYTIKNREVVEMYHGGTKEELPQKEVQNLANLLNTISKMSLVMWRTRKKLLNCICHLVLLNPHVAQPLTEKLLSMLSDPDFRVRLCVSKKITVLFQTWNGHEELFHDVCCNLGVKVVSAARESVITAREVLESGIQAEAFVETALVTLGQLAETSEKVEEEAIFVICATAAINPSHRLLLRSILDRIAKQLHYATRFKYLEQLMGSILCRWAKVQLSLASLVEMREVFVPQADTKAFIQNCSLTLVPLLILNGNDSELNWLAMVSHETVPMFVKNHFASVFAGCLPLHCKDNTCDQERAVVILQSSLLQLTEMSEDERDILIKKQMICIVSSLISLCSSVTDPYPPYYPKDTIVAAVKMVVDGFLEIDQNAGDGGVVDKINVFRPDRVFMFLLQIHYQIDSAVHPRHRYNPLARIYVLVDVLKHRVCIPSTCRYVIHIVLQSLHFSELQIFCCNFISYLLDIFESMGSKNAFVVLGDRLQSIVSKLVQCCIPSDHIGVISVASSPPSQLLSLLKRLTVDANMALHNYIKELEPLPELDFLGEVRDFHERLRLDKSPADDLIMFGKRSVSLPFSLRLKSLQRLHRKLRAREIFPSRDVKDLDNSKDGRWQCNDDLFCSVWSLVDLCRDDSAADMRDLVGDFIATMGVGDPYAVAFHLPDSGKQNGCFPENRAECRYLSVDNELGISEELVKAVIKLLQQYLLDDSVRTIDIAAKCLRGLLSTEKGQRVVNAMDTNEACYIQVLAKGINNKFAESLVSQSHTRSMDKVAELVDTTLWKIGGKTYEEWICQLVYALICCTNDAILKCCQDMVLLKAQLAELVFPHVLGILAGRSNEDSDICRTISTQIEENIFGESNSNLGSIQVVLDAMNELRLFYVSERIDSTVDLSRRKDNSKRSRRTSSNSRSSQYSEKLASDRAAPMKVHCGLSSMWQKVYWLQIDYLVTARAAIKCGSYFTSILYVEHWCEETYGVLSLGDPDFSYHEELPAHVEVLLKATKNINEPDGMYGIKSSKLVSQIFTYEHEGNWIKALENYDLFLRTRSPRSDVGDGCTEKNFQLDKAIGHMSSKHEDSNWMYYKGLMKSLQQTGCSHLLDLYSQGLASRKRFLQQDLEFTELQYETAWRAGQWDFYFISPETNSEKCCRQTYSEQITFNFHLHSCLRCLEEGDEETFWSKLKSSKKELVSVLSHTSMESTQNIHSTIVKLQILDHLSQVWHMRWRLPKEYSQCGNYKNKSSPLGPLVPSVKDISWLDLEWKCISRQMQLHFSLLEPFISFRRVLLQILNCKDSMFQHLLEHAKIFRKCGRLSQAAAYVHELKIYCADMENDNNAHFLCALGRIEEAKLLRARGQTEMAISLVENVLQNYHLGDEMADVYRLIGKWLAESRSQSSRTILDQYLKHAAEITEEKCLSGDDKWIDKQCKTHFRLAHYTDALFQSYEERLNSSEWQAALRLREYKAKELDAVTKRLKSLNKGEKTDYAAKVVELQKQLAMDKEEEKRLKDDRDSFLMMALDSYQRCLITGEKYNIRVVFRLVSLWFNLSSNHHVVDSMLQTVEKVQSYKFLPLVYQIASRMCSSKENQSHHSFQFSLTSLVKKMAIDHPYHTLLQLLALANGDRVKEKQRSKSAFVVDLDKKHAAEVLIHHLQSFHGAVLRQMTQMVELYIKLAELETKKEDTNRKIPLPRDIRSVRKLELVPVVTASLPVNQSCQYHEGSFPCYCGLSEHITVMNGINAPKVVECHGSDGHRYRQLAKSGNDDLRQDAVMEQFFGLVNTLLQEQSYTMKRRLKIRTYKVVPFTPSAGVLEWVDGTVPLGEYLIGSSRNGGAHGRYRKDDWSFLQCREYMANQKDKRNAFQTVCQNFRPAMHFFFLERFSKPADWFEKRLAYTRSVATSSMVGYIVGLGDRHSMNILIDQATAEVVHIDLGVAFEQGLMLKTPERVPFRLTRDIVDGMGVTGVEGIYRRCCEESLSVMRTNKEALLTIIEVFIHDPLYKWALSPLKALRRQKDIGDDDDSDAESSEEDNEGNKDAARALMRVKQKLDGYEDGEMRSIPGQVQQLIQDAMDSDRLCHMFPGWGAWL